MTEDQRWILMVEDDPIFSMLFARAWKAARPHVPIVVVESLAALRTCLEEATTPPSLLVMDQNLPDGNGHQVAPGLGLCCHCWSALGEGGAPAKPQGKPALEEAVVALTSLAGL